jgi:hypothetical protein
MVRQPTLTSLTLNLTLFFAAARIREEDSHSKPCNTLGRKTRGGDSNLITLKPTLTLYFQAVLSLNAFGGYTGIFLFLIVPSVVTE